MLKTQLSPTIHPKPLSSKSLSKSSSKSLSKSSSKSGSKSSSKSLSKSSSKSGSKSAAAFTAAVAAKDTNRFHNLPEDIQRKIMAIAKEKKKNSMGKYEIYKKIYNNREVFLEWLEEIKRNGVDDKKRVRNPLRKGGLIYTNKSLYSTILNLCITIFPADFKWDTIPPRIKIEYKQQNKFYNKPR